MSNRVEVLIVGAGPVGLSAALGLAQAKVPIRIIDRLPTPTDQSRITADVKIRWDRDPSEVVALLSADGIAFIAAMNDDRWRVIVTGPKWTHEQAEKASLGDVQNIVNERFRTKHFVV
jgi:thioredoxin reductase